MALAFINELCSYLVLIPAAILCYLPVHGRLAYSYKKLIALISVSFVLISTIGSLICAVTGINGNYFFYPMMFLFYWLYVKSVQVISWCSFTLFINSCSLMSILTNFAGLFDLYRNPSDPFAWVDWISGLFLFGISLLLTACLARPLYHQGSQLINELDNSSVWRKASWIPSLILAANLLVSSLYDEHTMINKKFYSTIILLGILLTMQIFTYFVFYDICRAILYMSEQKKSLDVFRVEKRQFDAQQKYIQETARMRHDFRQSIITLQNMAQENDLAAIQDYLTEYIHSMPESVIVHYSDRTPINALLGYYKKIFEIAEIRMNWQVDLPESLSISDVDLCSILGNLLENVHAGCETVPPDKRTHTLRIAVQNGNLLFISSINTFNGVVKQQRGRYVTTKKDGTSTGLYSIWNTALRYGGSVSYTNTENEFRYDIYMKGKK